MPLLRDWSVQALRLTPTQAELLLRLEQDPDASGVAWRGRVHGPRCRFSTTIEIAYPVRGLTRSDSGARPWSGRIVIPEPSWWDPQSPFLYVGQLEAWRGEECVERCSIRWGLTHAKAVFERLLWNGKPLTWQARHLPRLAAAELPALRSEGVNLAMVEADRVRELVDEADAWGILLAGLNADEAWLRDPRWHPYRHPSVLGALTSDGQAIVLTAGRGVLVLPGQSP